MSRHKALIAVYDFALFPYALGDVLTWNIRTALRCQRAGRDVVDVYVCIDLDAPPMLYQKDLVDPTNNELFFTELYSAFGTHPRLGNFYVYRSRADLIEHLHAITADDGVNAQIVSDYIAVAQYIDAPIPATEARDAKIRSYFEREILTHGEINAAAVKHGHIPLLKPALGCGPDVEALLRERFAGKEVVSFHLRLRQVDVGYGAAPSYSRDSNFLEWYDFLQRARDLYPDILFVALGRLQEKPLEILRLPNVISARVFGLGLGHELTLILRSRLFIGTSSGFAAFANFSPIPYFITKVTETSCRAYEIEYGAKRLPFASPHQELIYEPETSDLLLQLLERGLAVTAAYDRESNSAALVRVSGGERMRFGLLNPSNTTARFYTDADTRNEETVRLLLPLIHQAKQEWLAGHEAQARRIVNLIQRHFEFVGRDIPQFLLPAGGLSIEAGDKEAMHRWLVALQKFLRGRQQVSELLQVLNACLVLALSGRRPHDLDYRLRELKAKLTHASLIEPLAASALSPELMISLDESARSANQPGSGRQKKDDTRWYRSLSKVFRGFDGP